MILIDHPVLLQDPCEAFQTKPFDHGGLNPQPPVRPGAFDPALVRPLGVAPVEDLVANIDNHVLQRLHASL